MRITHFYHKMVFAALRRRIKKDPYIGQDSGSGVYLLERDGYSIGYRIGRSPGGKVSIEWVSQKRRLSAYEEKIRRAKRGFFDFWNYQKWLVFLRPAVLIFLAVGILFFYSELIETQETKMARIKWVIAAASGIAAKDIQYIGDGRLEISGRRRRTVERMNEPPQYVYEPIKYTFNPLRWLFSSDKGFIKIWRNGYGGGYARCPVVYNDGADVWYNNNGAWEHGMLSGGAIKWDRPQATGTGIRKTSGQEISVDDGQLKVVDK